MRILSLIAAVLLTGGMALADEPPASDSSAADAEVTLTGGSVAAGIGYVWGKGDLSFEGSTHAFKLSGISIVDVGVANMSAKGEVYNLKTLNDFGGNYTVATAGLTIAGGGSATYLRNEHGVVIKLLESSQGLRFNLAAEGVKISLRPS
jgi:outer membrane immunogenic protein